MAFSPSTTASPEGSHSCPTFIPFAEGPFLPFARVRAAEKSYMLFHCLIHPWIYWRETLLRRWSDSFPLANQTEGELILWVAPPKAPNENFFVQCYAFNGEKKSSSSELESFLAISWMHQIKRAFLSKDEIVSVRFESSFAQHEFRLIQNHVFVLNAAPQAIDVEVELLNVTAIEWEAWPHREESFRLFFVRSEALFHQAVRHLKALKKSPSNLLIFSPLEQKSATFLSFQAYAGALPEEQFTAGFIQFGKWFSAQPAYKLCDLECSTALKKYHFDPSSGKLWSQYRASWICHGQLSVSIDAKPQKNRAQTCPNPMAAAISTQPRLPL